MAKNLVRKEFLNNDTWICPAGVTQVRAYAVLYLFPQLAGATNASFAISTTGVGYGWGGNSISSGIGIGASVSSPVLIVGGLTWQQISSSIRSGGVGIATGGAAYAWGTNVRGQLGTGDVTTRSTPTAVLGGFVWKQVTCGGDSSYGISVSGDAYAWVAASLSCGKA